MAGQAPALDLTTVVGALLGDVRARAALRETISDRCFRLAALVSMQRVGRELHIHWNGSQWASTVPEDASPAVLHGLCFANGAAEVSTCTLTTTR